MADKPRTMIKSKLAHLRESKGLTQQELADRVFVEQSTISKYENNQRRMPDDITQRIADALNVEPEELRENQGGNVYFDGSSINNGNGIINTDTYYHVPKEFLDNLILVQQGMMKVMQVFVDKFKQL